MAAATPYSRKHGGLRHDRGGWCVVSALATQFDPKRNSLNVLRLVFASAVIVSHAWVLGGFGEEPLFGGLSLGGWAVAGFFVVSGYLIAGSRHRSSLPQFLYRRALRLFPGLWVCLIVIVFVFVPIAALHDGGAFPPGAGAVASFVVGNATLLGRDFGIDGTLASVPHPGSWNGSLWTLSYEVACYLILGLALSIAAIRRSPASMLGIFLAFTVASAADAWLLDLPQDDLRLLVHLGAFFFAGSALLAYADRIPLRTDLAVTSVIVIVVASLFTDVSAIAPLPTAYTCLWLGIRLPLQRVASVNDISYGVYIYAFPTQQLLVLFGVERLGLVAYIVVATAVTYPLAALSWFLVEKRALRHKTVPWRRRAVVRAVPPPARAEDPAR